MHVQAVRYNTGPTQGRTALFWVAAVGQVGCPSASRVMADTCIKASGQGEVNCSLDSIGCIDQISVDCNGSLDTQYRFKQLCYKFSYLNLERNYPKCRDNPFFSTIFVQTVLQRDTGRGMQLTQTGLLHLSWHILMKN